MLSKKFLAVALILAAAALLAGVIHALTYNALSQNGDELCVGAFGAGSLMHALVSAGAAMALAKMFGVKM